MSLKLQVLIALRLLVAIGEANLYFINPSPGGANSDYSADPVYTEGETLTVSWSGSSTGVPLSLVMLQQGLEGEGDASQEVIIGITYFSLMFFLTILLLIA